MLLLRIAMIYSKLRTEESPSSPSRDFYLQQRACEAVAAATLARGRISGWKISS